MHYSFKRRVIERIYKHWSNIEIIFFCSSYSLVQLLTNLEIWQYSFSPSLCLNKSNFYSIPYCAFDFSDKLVIGLVYRKSWACSTMVIQNSDGLFHMSTFRESLWSCSEWTGWRLTLCSMQRPLAELSAFNKAFMDGCRTAQSKVHLWG